MSENTKKRIGEIDACLYAHSTRLEELEAGFSRLERKINPPLVVKAVDLTPQEILYYTLSSVQLLMEKVNWTKLDEVDRAYYHAALGSVRKQMDKAKPAVFEGVSTHKWMYGDFHGEKMD